MTKNEWISLKNPEKKQVKTNEKKFKSTNDFLKSRSMRLENAKSSKLSVTGKAVYLLGVARMSNANKVASRGNKMTGYKIKT